MFLVPLSTYEELQDSIALWLARDDLSTPIVDFIRLAESRINRDLRVREMITQATGTLTSGDPELSLPDDFLQVELFTLATATTLVLKPRPSSDAYLRTGNENGEPKFYSIVGTNFIILPTPDGGYDYTLEYYAEIPALSDSNTSNWLLEKAPDVYLYAALIESAPFLQNDDRTPVWAAAYASAIASLTSSDANARQFAGAMQMRVL